MCGSIIRSPSGLGGSAGRGEADTPNITLIARGEGGGRVGHLQMGCGWEKERGKGKMKERRKSKKCLSLEAFLYLYSLADS